MSPAGPAVEIPESLDVLLTPEWLTGALSTRFPGVRVTAVIRGPVVERVSTNARFSITCEPELPAGLPSDLCVKGYFSERGRSAAPVGGTEASFYRDLAPHVGVRTLRSVWAGVAPETHHGVVITEDVVAAGGVFLDALGPCSVEQTASLLGELACLHAHAWNDPERAGAAWLAPRMGRTLRSRGLPQIETNFETIGAGVPPAVRDPERLVDAFRGLAERPPGPGWTVMHGDAHVGNTFLDAAGRPGLLDWQLVQRGHWGIDVGYHVASALEPDVRGANEGDLLRHYLDRLGSAGATPPPFDDAWTEYRRGISYGFFLWGITQYVARDITAALLRRLGTAAYELDSFAAVREL